MKDIVRLIAQRAKLRTLLLFSLLPAFCLSFSHPTDQPFLELTFQSQGHSIKGRFFPSTAKETAPMVILLQGFPGGEGDVLGLGQKLSHAGANVLTFNYSGTYRSEGEFTLESTLKDIKAAYDYLHQADIIARLKVDTSRIILGGWSYGGGMSVTYAATHPEIQRVFSLAGTDHGAFAREYSRNKEMERALDTTFDNLRAPQGPVHFTGSQILRDLAANPAPYDLRLSVPALTTRDIILFGGIDDAQVTLEGSLIPFYRALKLAKAEKVNVVVFQTNHGFRSVRDELAAELIRWVGLTKE